MTTIATKLACLAGLCSFSLLVSAAPPKRMLSIEGSAQKASNLCWAAVTEMAINAVAHPDPEMTQERQAAFAAAGITELPIPPDKLSDFNAQLVHCQAGIGNCNKRGHPVLEGISQQMPPSTQPLSKADLVSEIGDFGRPVIFSWMYPDTHGQERPTRGHYLILIGYDTTNSDEFLKVWDPWPVGEGDSRAIKYTLYKGVGLDMGLPVDHALTLRGLKKIVAPNPPTSVTVDGGGAPSQPTSGIAPDTSELRAAPSARPRFREVSFATAGRRSLSANQRGAILRQRSAGRTDSAALTVAAGFPILALHINAIVANRNTPERLLKTQTSSVLYPVMLGDQVVDSFLMANVGGRWVEMGYANTAITRQLVRWRTREMDKPDMAEKDFFVISVPHYAAFFTSFDPGRNAIAIPATTDRLINTQEGGDEPAVVVLKRIADAELRERAAGP